MLSIEEIKRCVKYAEGFDRFTNKYYNGEHIIVKNRNHNNIFSYDKLYKQNIYYSLFLQRVIEDFQMNFDSRLIIKATGNKLRKWFFRYTCSNGINYNESQNYDTPDQAKEEAIRYILALI